MRGQDPVEAFLDILLDDGLDLCIVGVGTNANTLPAFVSHPCGMVGSDAVLMGEFPSPRTYGCFPVILAENVRAEKQLRLPEAIRKMTSFPAQRLGLKTRGLLRDGYKADIVIFNPETVKAPATRDKPQAVPPRHPLRNRQRQSRRRRRPTLRPTPRPSPTLRPRLTPKIPYSRRRRRGPIPSPSTGEG